MLSLLSDVDFWQATWTVIKLSLLTWGCSIVLGFILALAKQSPRAWLSAPARLYIWLFRSMPLLVLLIFVYNMPQALPSVAPLLNDPFWAGLIAMVLSEAAYIAVGCSPFPVGKAKPRGRWAYVTPVFSGASLFPRPCALPCLRLPTNTSPL